MTELAQALVGGILIRGLGFLMKIQRVLLALGMLGLIVVVILLATTDTNSFANAYDDVAGPGSFDSVISVAKEQRAILPSHGDDAR